MIDFILMIILNIQLNSCWRLMLSITVVQLHVILIKNCEHIEHDINERWIERLNFWMFKLELEIMLKSEITAEWRRRYFQSLLKLCERIDKKEIDVRLIIKSQWLLQNYNISAFKSLTLEFIINASSIKWIRLLQSVMFVMFSISQFSLQSTGKHASIITHISVWVSRPGHSGNSKDCSVYSNWDKQKNEENKR